MNCSRQLIEEWIPNWSRLHWSRLGLDPKLHSLDHPVDKGRLKQTEDLGLENIDYRVWTKTGTV